MENRITWETAKNGGQSGVIVGEDRGYKARTLVFMISFEPQLGEKEQFALRHRLPFQQITRRFATVQLAQAHAERYLVMAAALLNFSPIPTTELARLRESDAELNRLVAAGVDNWEGYGS